MRLLSTTGSDAALKARIVEAEQAPVMAAMKARANIGRSRQEHDNAVLVESVVAFAAARALKASPDGWEAFADDSLWSGFEGHKPNPKKPQEHLRWMMNFVHEAKDERGKDRANVYRGALQAKFDEGAVPESLITFVKSERGIDKAYRNALMAVKPKTDASQDDDVSFEKVPASDESDRGDQASDEAGSSADIEGERERKAMFAKIGRHLNAMKGRSLMPILLGAPSILLDKIMDRYVNAGEVYLRCTLTRKPDGWVDVTVTKAWRRNSKP